MKSGEVYLAKITEYRTEGLFLDIKDEKTNVKETVLLSADKICGGLKSTFKKKVGWWIPVRVESLRPFQVTNLRITRDKLAVLGLSNSKPVETYPADAHELSKGEDVAPLSILVQEKRTKAKTPGIRAECAPLLHGVMIYWNKVEKAATYYVHLLIRTKREKRKAGFDTITREVEEKISYQELAVEEVPRNLYYHSFLNLAKIHREETTRFQEKITVDYYIYVEAEDRRGEKIAESEKIPAEVYEMRVGSYSYGNY